MRVTHQLAVKRRAAVNVVALSVRTRGRARRDIIQTVNRPARASSAPLAGTRALVERGRGGGEEEGRGSQDEWKQARQRRNASALPHTHFTTESLLLFYKLPPSPNSTLKISRRSPSLEKKSNLSLTHTRNPNPAIFAPNYPDANQDRAFKQIKVFAEKIHPSRARRNFFKYFSRVREVLLYLLQYVLFNLNWFPILNNFF